MKKIYKEYIYITLGSTLFALGTIWFADPSGLVPGGVSGIAIIVKKLSANKIPLYITNIVLNIPLFIIAYTQRGFSFIKKSLLGVIWISFSMSLLSNSALYFNLKNDIFLSSIMCGVFSGIGLGLILKSKCTTGGTDMLASIIKYRHANFPISQLILIIDSIIIIFGFLIFGITKGLYSILSLYICIKIIENIIEGISFTKTAFIISKNSDNISNEIFRIMNRGNTGIDVQGMFSKENYTMLLVVCNIKEISILQNIVEENDKNAFMIIYDARLTLGNGFTDFDEYKNMLN